MPGKLYCTTVLDQHPEYAGQWLLLTTWDGKRLFRTAEKELVGVSFDPDIGRPTFRNTTAGSLAALGQRHLGRADPSVRQMLLRLVTPEMELERVFNVFRYRYLRSLFSRNRGAAWVAERLDCSFNDLFKVLIGAPLRRDGDRRRRDNILTENGFDPADLPERFDDVTQELGEIIAFMRTSRSDRQTTYREFIAIKPGLHEVWFDLREGHGFHAEECEVRLQDDPQNRRDRVLAAFHGLPDFPIDWDEEGIPHEINRSSYRTFSPCHATQGPCFARRHPGVSLHRVLVGAGKLWQQSQPASAKELILSRCLVYDYCHDIRVRKTPIEEALQRAREFTEHAVRWRHLKRG